MLHFFFQYSWFISFFIRWNLNYIPNQTVKILSWLEKPVIYNCWQLVDTSTLLLVYLTCLYIIRFIIRIDPFINGYRILNFIHPKQCNSFKITITKGARFRPEIQLMFYTRMTCRLIHVRQIVETIFQWDSAKFELRGVLFADVPFLKNSLGI
jgi:hypothetical protein